jgi:hypothetical protein
MTKEIWKSIPGYAGAYEVSSYGRVRSLDRYIDFPRVAGHCRAHRHLCRGRLLRAAPASTRYLSVVLGRDNTQNVHVLVALAFLPPRPSPKHEVRHLDGSRTNNVPINLAWGTRAQNNRDKKHHGTGRLTIVDVQKIKTALKHPWYGQLTDLARSYEVSVAAISAIKHGRNHVDVVV